MFHKPFWRCCGGRGHPDFAGAERHGVRPAAGCGRPFRSPRGWAATVRSRRWGRSGGVRSGIRRRGGPRRRPSSRRGPARRAVLVHQDRRRCGCGRQRDAPPPTGRPQCRRRRRARPVRATSAAIWPHSASVSRRSSGAARMAQCHTCLSGRCGANPVGAQHHRLQLGQVFGRRRGRATTRRRAGCRVLRPVRARTGRPAAHQAATRAVRPCRSSGHPRSGGSAASATDRNAAVAWAASAADSTSSSGGWPVVVELVHGLVEVGADPHRLRTGLDQLCQQLPFQPLTVRPACGPAATGRPAHTTPPATAPTLPQPGRWRRVRPR